MIHTLVLWFVVISIFLFLWNRKRFFSLWKKIIKKGINFAGILLKKIFTFLWDLFKKTLWFLPRFLYWLGWLIVEFVRFIYNAMKALISILRA